MRRLLLSVLLLNAAMAWAQANISDAEDITAEIVLTGATTVPIAVKQGITQQINQAAAKIGSLDSPEFIETLRDLFQQHGYLKASIGDPQWGPIQGDGKHRHVRITVAVDEGSLYRTGAITFKDSSVFERQALRAAIPIMDGEIFNVEQMRVGLKNLRNMYCSKGFVNFIPLPNTEINNDNLSIAISFDLDEGDQYRVGQLTLDGVEPYPDAGNHLLEAWKPHVGQIYDCRLFNGAFSDASHDNQVPAFDPALASAIQRAKASGLETSIHRETKTIDFRLEFPDPK
jgi:hypothetical protein